MAAQACAMAAAAVPGPPQGPELPSPPTPPLLAARSAGSGAARAVRKSRSADPGPAGSRFGPEGSSEEWKLIWRPTNLVGFAQALHRLARFAPPNALRSGAARYHRCRSCGTGWPNGTSPGPPSDLIAEAPLRPTERSRFPLKWRTRHGPLRWSTPRVPGSRPRTRTPAAPRRVTPAHPPDPVPRAAAQRRPLVHPFTHGHFGQTTT
jgi:hypothetical protein